jgi:kynureninase
MPKIVRTYQQNFITAGANDIWDFTFANIPHKAKPSNRFKVSVSSMSAYISTATGVNVFTPHAIWAKGLTRSIANTSAGSIPTSQVLGDTLLGILGNGYDVNVITASTTKNANSLIGTPYYYYLDEMPTTPFQVYYTDITSYTYSSAVPNLQLLISFLIEEEEH